MTMTPTKTTMVDGDDDGRYEFCLFAATTNFHENSRGFTLYSARVRRNSSLDVASSSFEIAHISVPTELPSVNFTLFAHSSTSVKIRYRALFVRLFHARFSDNQKIRDGARGTFNRKI